MLARIIDVTISAGIVILVIYLLKWIFVRNWQVPFITDVLKEV